VLLGLASQTRTSGPFSERHMREPTKVSSPSQILNFFYLKMGRMTCYPAKKYLKNNKVRQCVAYFPLISAIMVVEKSRFMVF